MSFLMLALALAGHTQVASWQALDFLHMALPQDLLQDPARPGYRDGIQFFTNGPCSNYSGIAHYYDDRGHGCVCL